MRTGTLPRDAARVLADVLLGGHVAHLLAVFPLLHQGHPIDGASTANVTRVLARHTYAPADAV